MITEKRLPYNKKEGFLYGTVICSLTVAFMVILNTYINIGSISYKNLPNMLKIFVLLFIIAMCLENFIVSIFSKKMSSIYISKNDSFNSQILFTVLFTVVGMSFLMTWIAPYISSGFDLSVVNFTQFIASWPKNFGIVFAFELIIAQPLARKFMVMIHTD